MRRLRFLNRVFDTFSRDALPGLEHAFGRFSRSLDLPEGIDAEAVTAEFDG